MPILLPLLDVIFVGLVGTDPGHIDRQLLAAENRLKVKKVAAGAVRALAANDDASAEVARRLNADGVVVGELVGQGKTRALRLVIYSGSGAMTSMTELPLGIRRTLNRDDITVLKSNLGDEVTSLLAAKPSANRSASTAKRSAPAAAFAAASPTGAGLAGWGEDDDPLGHSAQAVKPTTVATATSEPDSEVSVKASSDESIPVTGSAKDRIDVDAGLSILSRSFDPGPSTVHAYGAGSISAFHLDAVAHPIDRVRVALSYDHTVGMETVLEGQSMEVGSLMGRWEATAAYSIYRGGIDLAPIVGVGSRSFAIDAPAMGRSPDGSYTYVIIGGAATYPVTSKLALHGYFDFQPLVAGAEPTIDLVGASSRFGLNAGVAADYQVTDHIYARASADYQRIEWSWAAQNNVPQGAASDSYSTASLAVGARY